MSTPTDPKDPSSPPSPPPPPPPPNLPPAIERFPPSTETTMLASSTLLKAQANSLFTISDYDAALNTYERSLAELPSYTHYEHAVLRSNMAACLVRMGEWKRAVEEADKGLERLGDYEVEYGLGGKEGGGKDGDGKGRGEGGKGGNGEERVVEVSDEQEAKMADMKYTEQDVLRIRMKLLLRRAKARTEEGGWAALAGAQEGLLFSTSGNVFADGGIVDYKTLDGYSILAPADRKTVQTALRSLPQKLDEAKQKEMGEMMGKLKQLGNGLLKPFGLSTDNFNMVKDENTGGYNMNFNQNR
ncbi:hypothetical protein BT63DRAFT_299504 [Microthyrium microscopicum]|uniref:Uncharacterized protein n=1 Tax=Microthyrium microscopicum TaxID=703497 RepID=A0A6A6U708_9PEZI|nr:hypothetical protein BT63DRAFT_299504 [Microthyrium microscopicum]